MSAQVAADLRAAADVLERDGWCRFNFTRSDGSHCTSGAFHEIAPKDGGRRVAMQAAFRAVTGCAPVYFNDYIAADASQVIAALRAAADRAEAETDA